MPVGRAWWWLAAVVIVTGGLAAYVFSVRSASAWVVIAFGVVLLALVVGLVRDAMRRNAAFLRTLGAEDRERHYPAVPARRMWLLLPVPVVITGLATWASIEDWLGFPGWNAVVYAVWFPYSLVLFRSLAARRAAREETSGE